MELIYNNFYILTGGPGTGKTSVLNALEEKGFYCVQEVARKIIREQIACGGNAVPWGDIAAYTLEMLKYSIHVYDECRSREDICFFDRGIPDTYAYACLTKQKNAEQIRLTAQYHRYNMKVFLFPAWEKIYCTDSERKQDFDEAIRTYEIMKYCYTELQYDILEVPKVTVGERIEFILQNLI